MGLFSSTSGTERPDFWNLLSSEAELRQALEASVEQPVVLFKHSTRCIISKTVLRNFENEVENAGQLPFKFYFLDLLSQRELSNEIAQVLGVTHQSPQVIVVSNQEAVYDASHDGISLESLLKQLQ